MSPSDTIKNARHLERQAILQWLRSPDTQQSWDDLAKHMGLNHHPLDILAFSIEIGSHLSQQELHEELGNNQEFGADTGKEPKK